MFLLKDLNTKPIEIESQLATIYSALKYYCVLVFSEKADNS